MPYTKAISPVSNSYLTKGKEYEIVWIDDDPSKTLGHGFDIIADDGENLFCVQHDSIITGGLSWQLK